MRVFQVPELCAKFLKFNMKGLRELWLEAPTVTPSKQYEDQECYEGGGGTCARF